MNILVFNCGSSSLNYKVFSSGGAGAALEVLCSGKAHRVGVSGSEPSFIEHRHGAQVEKSVTPIPDHAAAARLALEHLAARGVSCGAIGHRFVHGGGAFQNSTLLTPQTLERLQETLPLAPIHNPNSLSVIHACRERHPDLPQYVTFDTAFHAGMEAPAYTYGVPPALAQAHGLRKYGFHGLSYQYVAAETAHLLGQPPESLRIVACHLGTGGSSVAALRGGRSVDTSMGFSPLPGLMMSTRCGDLDPLVAPYLEEQEGLSPQALNDLFNKQSGLAGISGISSDLRDCIRAMDGGNARAALAFEMYAYRLKKAIGEYAAALGGMDALVFTDDIGVQNARLRAAACSDMQWCGVRLDERANASAPPDCPTVISPPGSVPAVLCMPTDEEGIIGLEGARLLQQEVQPC